MTKRRRRRRTSPLHYDEHARLSSYRLFDRVYTVLAFLLVCLVAWVIFRMIVG